MLLEEKVAQIKAAKAAAAAKAAGGAALAGTAASEIQTPGLIGGDWRNAQIALRRHIDKRAGGGVLDNVLQIPAQV